MPDNGGHSFGNGGFGRSNFNDPIITQYLTQVNNRFGNSMNLSDSSYLSREFYRRRKNAFWA